MKNAHTEGQSNARARMATNNSGKFPINAVKSEEDKM
jgi:hypothetical protein